MRVAGIIDISTVDIPKIPVSVLFTAGCNFACPYCHNFAICRPSAGQEIPIEKIIDKLLTNVMVEGINVTGGEPTLQNDLVPLIQDLRERGIKFIGIDSNGSRPNVIQELAGSVNRFAIDFKAPWDHYGGVIGVQNHVLAVKESIRLVNANYQGDLELRTTVIREFHTSTSLKQMARYLHSLHFTGTWVLQQYQFSKGVNPAMKNNYHPWSYEELAAISNALKSEFDIPMALRTVNRGYEVILL